MKPTNYTTDFWDFGLEKENRIHKIHSYPAKFPGFITTKALEYAKGKGVVVKTMADPFCGCGTTAVEAKKKGIRFWGCDINPVATLIAQTKIRNYDLVKLDQYFSSIIKSYGLIKINKKELGDINERIKHWFDDTKIANLLKLKKAIERNTAHDSPYRKFFLCAFSNILKSTSIWASKSIKPQIDPNKTPADVLPAFQKQFRLMRKASNEYTFPKGKLSHTQIMYKNFLSLNTSAYEADIIITSPPYINSYNYANIHQLSGLWLGMCSDYRDLRLNMIGSTYQIKIPADEDIQSLSKTGQSIYQQLLKQNIAKSKSTARYFIDIKKSIENCYEILNQNGMVIFLIGNTNYQSVQIDNASFMQECMQQAGFLDIQKIARKISLKQLSPFRDEKGRLAKNSDRKQVYKYEYVIIGTKK